VVNRRWEHGTAVGSHEEVQVASTRKLTHDLRDMTSNDHDLGLDGRVFLGMRRPLRVDRQDLTARIG
jgi:hypothetical protein